MINLKDITRYDLLRNQLQLNSLTPLNRELEESLIRIFLYVYKNTKIMHIEFINEQVLFDYIDFQRSKGFKEVSFIKTVKDIKNFIYFLKYIRKSKYTPKMDLSVSNYLLWTNLCLNNDR